MLKSSADIVDPAIRAAALLYEQATGRSLVEDYPNADEPMLELILIMQGYPADREDESAGHSGSAQIAYRKAAV